MIAYNKPILNLALQGGGSHGAFTWGVLDALLEDGRYKFEGVSGTSAGAMNAICLAQGLMTGGNDGARQTLADFWHSIASSGSPFTTFWESHHASTAMRMMLQWTKHLSPEQINPMDINPVRDVLLNLIDFDRLRTESPVKLFIAATHANSGKVRIFKNQEMKVEAALASACLPEISHTVIIDGEPYWDGGFSANPAIFPLFWECDSSDLLVVLLTPLRFSETPYSPKAVQNRLLDIAFNSNYLREMRMFAHMKEELSKLAVPSWKFERKLRNVHFHAIHAGDTLENLPPDSKLAVNMPFFERLKNSGREYAQQWLEEFGNDVGVKSSLDLSKVYY